MRAPVVLAVATALACSGGTAGPGTASPSAAATLAADADPDSLAAHRAALAWLALVDQGRWQESLDSADPLLRQMAGSAAGWQRFIEQARAHYPVSADRDVVAWEPSYTPQAGPPGDYARLVLHPRGTTTHESVVLLRTTEGWRVAMYALGGS